MSLDLAGISNENDFYTHHYLAAILENDLKDLFSSWAAAEKEGKGKPPAERLDSLRPAWIRFRNDLARTSDREERRDLQRTFFTEFFANLGYPVTSSLSEMGDGSVIPLFS